MSKKGYLLLANGQLFEGTLMGAQRCAAAQLVFNTAVVGYMDTLTDPCYAGQIVIQTFPAIGNYGVVPVDAKEGAPCLSGFVVRELCDAPSNFRCQGKLSDYLAQRNIPCLTGVDTRALTRIVRSQGVMNAAILTEKPEDIQAEAAKLSALDIRPAAAKASCRDVIPAGKQGRYHVVLWDFGAGRGAQAELEKRGCAVTCVPAETSCQQILALAPDGVLLSGGPGDPKDNVGAIGEVQEMCRHRLPVFAIGLGHQLLALSQGADTVKMHHGHHGGNQLAQDVKTGLCYMTTQNHLYAVDASTLPAGASQRFVNGNDGSCEGVDYTDMPAFSVQFCPEALDTRFLFDRFTALMGGNKGCR